MDRSGSASHERRLELVVVALPSPDDVVRQYSSEKEPHLTLLYLGENPLTPAELSHITGYIEHAASQISSFGLEVERRGVLGDKEADVLFFEKRWAKRMAQFRSHLLQDELINKLYHSTPQFPEWTPHLTMGYPDQPAKKDDREYQRYSYVRFDRIALWTEDSSGPTFQLKTDDYDLEVAMSQAGANIAANILADHGNDAVQYGVPGMKWGVRKKPRSYDGPPENVRVKSVGRHLLSEGGGRRPASDDAARAAASKQILKKSGVNALNNKDLEDLVKRMNLEQQLGKLTPPSRAKKARMYVGKTLSNVGNTQLNMALNQAASAQVAAALAKVNK